MGLFEEIRRRRSAPPIGCAIDACGTNRGILFRLFRPDGTWALVCGRCREDLIDEYGWALPPGTPRLG